VPTANTAVGVDLGGTKTEAVVVELGGEEPRILARHRVATPAADGPAEAPPARYARIVASTREVIDEVVRAAGLASAARPPIGVGMPGGLTDRSPDGSAATEPRVKNSNTTCLNGRPFHADLSRAVGAEITFANDANCFALAEVVWGAARGARVTFGVIMGTGVGGGLVLGDRAWDGAQGIAGEWGHVVLDPVAGPPCYCGRRGCVETYLSGPAFEAAYAARTSTRPGAARTPLSEIASLAAAGDDDARATLAERMEIFGRALAGVIDIVDPDVIVLGGGVSNLDLLYTEGRAAVARWVFNDRLSTRIVKNVLGDSAGVLGAALLPPRVTDR